jgi:hypothetical protein
VSTGPSGASAPAGGSPPAATTCSAATSRAAILRRLNLIAERIQPLGARVVVNTVYDPSDGDNNVGRRELGLSRLAMIELRRRLNAVNRGIGTLARERSFLLGDLERLFHGHDVASDEPWFVQVIEPNLASASAIAEQRNPLWVIDVTNDAIRLRR